MRDLYARMLLTRIVDDCAWRLHKQGLHGLIASCRGHEAAQVGSAICIEVGKDFTLPYYRDLGVVLTIGMTPYEVFRTYTQMHSKRTGEVGGNFSAEYAVIKDPQTMHWGYHKHNMVTGSVPVATQVLHAAGIAFASKLRRAPVVTVAYCGDGAAAESDFLEGVTFAAQHQLPAVFICEQDASSSSLHALSLPANLEYHRVDGTDVILVYAAMCAAMQHVRRGHGPVLLEINVHRSAPDTLYPGEGWEGDPLLRCQRHLKEQGMWDEEWAEELRERLTAEVEQAVQDALRGIS